MLAFGSHHREDGVEMLLGFGLLAEYRERSFKDMSAIQSRPSDPQGRRDGNIDRNHPLARSRASIAIPLAMQAIRCSSASSRVLKRYTPLGTKVVSPVGNRCISSLNRAPSARSAPEGRLTGRSLRFPTVLTLTPISLWCIKATALLRMRPPALHQSSSPPTGCASSHSRSSSEISAEASH